VDEIAGCLARAGLAASRLLLEVSQSIMANEGATVIARLERLRGLGVRIAIGDFGGGYSSLTSLAILPVDVLKFDRAFINQISERPGANELMRALIDMGQARHLEVVTEGVDEIDQFSCCELDRDRSSRLLPSPESDQSRRPAATSGNELGA
jgi:EAL domain-containing protein (putative c-di-GMP-specific phosphodiesterase class I)